MIVLVYDGVLQVPGAQALHFGARRVVIPQCRDTLLLGVEQCALRIEHFQTEPPTLDPSKEHAFEIELKDSGITLQVRADQTILSALKGANIDVQSDCCEGLCGSCETRVLSGAVDHRDVVLTRGERDAQDRMMVCCSRAAGDKLVLEL